MIFLIKCILLCAIEWGRFCWKIVMCQSKLLSYECFTLKIFLLGRTQCQEFDCLYWAKRYCHPCTLDVLFWWTVYILQWKMPEIWNPFHMHRQNYLISNGFSSFERTRSKICKPKSTCLSNAGNGRETAFVFRGIFDVVWDL